MGADEHFQEPFTRYSLHTADIALRKQSIGSLPLRQSLAKYAPRFSLLKP